MRHAEEAVSVFGRPRALVRALPTRVGVEHHAVHVPHLDAGDLVHWQTGNGQTLEMHRVSVRIPTGVDGFVHVLEQDAVRRRQCWLHVTQYSVSETGFGWSEDYQANETTTGRREDLFFLVDQSTLFVVDYGCLCLPCAAEKVEGGGSVVKGPYVLEETCDEDAGP